MREGRKEGRKEPNERNEGGEREGLATCRLEQHLNAEWGTTVEWEVSLSLSIFLAVYLLLYALAFVHQ